MKAGSRTAALLAALMLASPALAEPKGPSEKDKQTASELVKKAIVKSQAGDHESAIKIYLQANTIVPNPVLLSNIATEFQSSGKPAEALRYFCMYLDEDPGGTHVVYATSQAKALQIQLGNRNVDERDVCAPPKPDRREPRRKEPVDEPVERPPSRTPPIVEVQERDKPPSGDKKLMYGGVASGIAGLAAIGVGAYAGIRARAISDEISSHDKTKPWPNDIRDTERRGQLFETVQIGALIAGGALVVTGAVLYVVGRSDSTEPARDRTVRVAPTTNGVVVFGRF
jgi:hypothetical protein